MQCDALGHAQKSYIIGKGRTGRAGEPPHNQNWGLRLREVDGTARLSFVFRDERDATSGGEEFWHRWTSTTGFLPGEGWHHVAVSYKFGDPESAHGWIDGAPITGEWDMGGATDLGPWSDDDEVWIGTAMGGSASSSFRGRLDEIAVYRAALSGRSHQGALRGHHTQARGGQGTNDQARTDSRRASCGWMFSNTRSAKPKAPRRTGRATIPTPRRTPRAPSPRGRMCPRPGPNRGTSRPLPSAASFPNTRRAACGATAPFRSSCAWPARSPCRRAKIVSSCEPCVAAVFPSMARSSRPPIFIRNQPVPLALRTPKPSRINCRFSSRRRRTVIAAGTQRSHDYDRGRRQTARHRL